MNNNSPHIEPELLSAYLDNEVTTAERAVIEAHVPGCVACQTELAGLRWTVSLVQALPQPSLPRTFYITEAMLSPEPPPRQAAPWWRIFAPWGALVAALLVIVVFARPTFMNSGAPTSDTAAVESAPAAAPEMQIAVAPTGPAAGGAPVPVDSSARNSDTLTMATAETTAADTAETAEEPAADTAIAPESTQVKIEDGAANEPTSTYSTTAPMIRGADTQASDVTAAEPAPPIEQSTLSENTPTVANTTVIVATIVVLLVVIAAVIVRGMRA